MIASFDVTQRLEYSDNPDLEDDGDSDFYGRTLLGFNLDSETKLSQFAFDLGLDVEEGREGNSTFDLTNSFAGVSYNRATRNAYLDAIGRVSETDQNSNDFDNDFDQDGNVINQDDGKRRSYRVGLGMGIGQEAPIGARFRWDYNEINFTDTDDDDLSDSSENDLSAQIDFRIDPRITASLTAKYNNFDASGEGVDRETVGFGTEFSLDVTKIDTVDLFLEYDSIDLSGDENRTEDGLSGGIDWVRDTPTGSYGVSYESDVTSNEDGRRGFLSVFRDVELPRGALSVRLGVTGSDTIGNDPLIDVTYLHNWATSRLTVNASQSVVTDSDNNEQINTSVRANYNREINSLSNFGIGLSFFDRNELQDDPNDGQRVDLRLTYQYDLTRNWGLVTGYTYILSTQDEESDRSSNTVFLGLQRSFNWVP